MPRRNNPTGETWGEIDANETKAQNDNKLAMVEEEPQPVVEEKTQPVVEEKTQPVVEENPQPVVEEKTQPEIQSPLTITYNLMQLLDEPARQKFKIENIEEITRIIIGKSGFYLKNITYQSGVQCIWCRNIDSGKTFDITFYSDNANIYSGQIVFWMLKRRVNEVVNYFYKH